MRVAAIHFGKSSDLDENERNLLDLNIEAATKGADLIVNPEMSILPLISPSAPIKHNSEAKIIAESRTYAKWFAQERGPRLVKHFIEEVAVAYKKYVVISVITSDPQFNILYSSALVIGPKSATAPDGIYHIYHKREPHGDVFAMKGASELQPVRLDIGNIGVMICSDYSVPLISRSLTLNGSDLIVIPTAITSPTADTLKARALENGIPFVAANCYEYDWVCSKPWMPESAIVGADGQVTSTCDQCEDRILIDDFDFSSDAVQLRKVDKLKPRRPQLYEGALVDLTSPHLRSSCSLPESSVVWAITVSGVALAQDGISAQAQELIASVQKRNRKKKLPVIVVLPELSLERKAVQAYLDYFQRQNAYVACGFIENSHRIVALFDPSGRELLSYRRVHLSDDDERNGFQSGDRLEFYLDLPIGRIGILAGEDLYYPEALEVHRNVAVDFLLVPSRLNLDADCLFKDVAQSRHISLAVADHRYKGGIYKRAPNYRAATGEIVNALRFDTQEGKIEPARGLPSISLQGFQAIVRIEPAAFTGSRTGEEAS